MLKVTGTKSRMNLGTSSDRSVKVRVYVGLTDQALTAVCAKVQFPDFTEGCDHAQFVKDQTMANFRYSRVLLSALDPQTRNSMGLDDNAKLRWSRTAGCSCGCSPGFVVEGQYGMDFYVTMDVAG
jgi:hypothetical protein